MAAKTTEEDMKIDKIKKQKVQHLVNNTSEGFNIYDGEISFFVISNPSMFFYFVSWARVSIYDFQHGGLATVVPNREMKRLQRE